MADSALIGRSIALLARRWSAVPEAASSFADAMRQFGDAPYRPRGRGYQQDQGSDHRNQDRGNETRILVRVEMFDDGK
uniref:hypothetical protein n=1 Tax=Nocardia suismassiliense TaxID=2077092 RepID=UPI003F4908CC